MACSAAREGPPDAFELLLLVLLLPLPPLLLGWGFAAAATTRLLLLVPVRCCTPTAGSASSVVVLLPCCGAGTAAASSAAGSIARPLRCLPTCLCCFALWCMTASPGSFASLLPTQRQESVELINWIDTVS
jgi:hypothetical protein